VSKKIKVLLIFGTRPETIKIAPIFWELSKNKSLFEVTVCLTSQHKSMVLKLIKLFGIKVDYDLKIMKKGQNLAELTSNLIKKTNIIVKKVNPDFVLVQGDTISSYAGALCAFYNNIKICHVEAGLRSFNMLSPFPEEFYRKSISSISYLNFAPTKVNKNNLLEENHKKETIYITGNTVIDCLITSLNLYNSKNNIYLKVNKNLNKILNFDWKNEKFILITGHRRENIGKAFQSIMSALAILAENNPDIKFVYPIHPNPLVRSTFTSLTKNFQNFYIIEPLKYYEFLVLLSKCFFVMTDSGGIQEEAPTFGKPVLVMRDTTERVEGINAGVVKLVGSNINKITYEANLLISDINIYKKMSHKNNPYGDGKASERIVKIMKDRFV